MSTNKKVYLIGTPTQDQMKMVESHELTQLFDLADFTEADAAWVIDVDKRVLQNQDEVESREARFKFAVDNNIAVFDNFDTMIEYLYAEPEDTDADTAVEKSEG